MTDKRTCKQPDNNRAELDGQWHLHWAASIGSLPTAVTRKSGVSHALEGGTVAFLGKTRHFAKTGGTVLLTFP